MSDSDVSYEGEDGEVVSLDEDEDIDEDDNDSSIDGDENEEEENKKRTEEDNITVETSSSTAALKYKFIFGDERNKKNKFITKFAYARLVGLRAQQIETNSPGPHEITKRHPDAPFLTTALDIAKFELDHEEIPFPTLLLRRINIGSFPLFFEVWDVRELKLPFDVQQEKKLGLKPYKISSFNYKNNV